MPVEKSELFNCLYKGVKTLFVGIGEAKIPNAPLNSLDGYSIMNLDEFKSCFNEYFLNEFKEFDRVIFYSYLKFRQHELEINHLASEIGEDKCVFMFKEL